MIGCLGRALLDCSMCGPLGVAANFAEARPIAQAHLDQHYGRSTA